MNPHANPVVDAMTERSAKSIVYGYSAAFAALQEKANAEGSPGLVEALDAILDLAEAYSLVYLNSN